MTVPMKEHGALCLRCAATFPMPSGKRVICPKCGWSISASDFNLLWSLAHRTFRYGHQYRRIYEKQVKRSGEIRAMYNLLDPPGWAVVMTLWAISGIVGNRADALVMRGLKQLFRSQAKQRKGAMGLSTHRGIAILVRDTRDYMEGMDEVHVTVRSAIKEEEGAAFCGKEAAKVIRGVDPNDPVALRKALENVYRRAIKKMNCDDTTPMNRAKLQRLLSDEWNELPE